MSIRLLDNKIKDFMFVQVYEHYYGTPEEPEHHPYLPGCGCYYLGDTMGIYSLDCIVGPVRMIPNFAPHSDREPPGPPKRSSRSTGRVERAMFFAFDKIM
jgi:hypothetical protein